MYSCIEAHREHYDVSMMCRLLRVSRSGFYDWLRRTPSERALRDRELLTLIREVFEDHQERYGAMRVWKELQARGVDVGRDRVRRLMRGDGLQARALRRRKPRTTDSEHSIAVPKNLLARNFQAAAINQVWLADITYFPTRQGWVYLYALMDMCSRRVIGWSLRDNLKRDGALDALSIALANRKLAPNAIHHSDRGVQYACRDYQSALELAGLCASMSRKGDCWDNAPMESFFGRLKEEIGVRVFDSKPAARQAVFSYIEMYYNPRRRHSALGYVSPAQYEIDNDA